MSANKAQGVCHFMTNILQYITSHMVDLNRRYKHFRVIPTVQLTRKREL